MKKILFAFSFILLLPLSVFSQNLVEITGTVVDNENGMPIPGANIFEKGNTGHGAMTDFDGNFSLQTSKNATLVVSFIGYATQTISVKNVAVGDLKNLKVQLNSEASALEEVVIVGYGQQKRVTVTGAISSIGSEELASSPSASVETI